MYEVEIVEGGYLKEKDADHKGASRGTDRPMAARGSRLRTKPLVEREKNTKQTNKQTNEQTKQKRVRREK